MRIGVGNAQLLPQRNLPGGRALAHPGVEAAVLSAEILNRDLYKVAADVFRRPPFRWHAEQLAKAKSLVLAPQFIRSFAVQRGAQGEQQMAGMAHMPRGAADSLPQKIARNHGIGGKAADAGWRGRRNAARAHIADTAASALLAEFALALGGGEPVAASFYSFALGDGGQGFTDGMRGTVCRFQLQLLKPRLTRPAAMNVTSIAGYLMAPHRLQRCSPYSPNWDGRALCSWPKIAQLSNGISTRAPLRLGSGLISGVTCSMGLVLKSQCSVNVRPAAPCFLQASWLTPPLRQGVYRRKPQRISPARR